ncbi:MAG: diguanylate cyclase, partial [Bacillota bacterium]
MNRNNESFEELYKRLTETGTDKTPSKKLVSQNLAGNAKLQGMIEQGNIDLFNRPKVKNADGSISTVRSMNVNFDGQEVLIPTVSDDGRILSEKEAVDLYLKTGKHLGKFNSVGASNQYAKSLHNQQEKLYTKPQAMPTQKGNVISNSTKKDESFEELYKRLTGIDIPEVNLSFKPKKNTVSEDFDFQKRLLAARKKDDYSKIPAEAMTSEQMRKQQLAAQQRNIETVSAIPASKIKPSKNGPLYPGSTLEPVVERDRTEVPTQGEITRERLHELQNFLGDPALHIQNALNKPAQYAKTVVSQGAGDILKGLSLGAVDLNQGKVLGHQVLPGNAEFLQSSGVSPDIANRELTGFKVGNVIPALKNTIFDWDIHPVEWAAMGPAVGAVSRGLMSKISRPVGEFLYKKAPAVLKPLIPTMTRIVNSGLTGGAVNTASGLLQGQGVEQIPGNFGTGAAFGSAFGLVAEGMNVIARAPMAYRANLYKQAVDKMARWAYGEGRFNSYDEAFQAADNVLSREVNSRGGLRNLRPKDLKGFNQAVEVMLKKSRGVSGDTTPMVDQAIVDSVNANVVTSPSNVPSNFPETQARIDQAADQPSSAASFHDMLTGNVQNMNPDDIVYKLYHSEKAGEILNEAAYIEAQKNPKPWQMYADMDGLKRLNDTFGHRAGDAAIRAVGEAMKAAGLTDAFHLHGDEFAGQGDTREELEASMKKVEEILKSATIEVTLQDGTVNNIALEGISYGIAQSGTDAESAMYQHKEARTLAGERRPREGTGVLPGAVGPQSGAGQNSAGSENNGDSNAGRDANRSLNINPTQDEPGFSVSNYKPGDRIVDKAGHEWTVVDANGKSLLTVKNTLGTETKIGRSTVAGRAGEMQTAIHQQTLATPKAPLQGSSFRENVNSKELDSKIKREIETAAFERAMKKMGFSTLDELNKNGTLPPQKIKLKGLFRYDLYQNQRHQFESLVELYEKKIKNDDKFIQSVIDEYNKHQQELNRTKQIEDSFNKEDWQVPQDIMLERSNRVKELVIESHRSAIEKALQEGKSVPDEVLADYPDLQQKYNPHQSVDSAVLPTKEQPSSKLQPSESGVKAESSLVKTITDKYLAMGWKPDVAEKCAKLLADAIEKGTYTDLLHPRNTKSRAIYKELTGKKLPKTVGGTKAMIEGTYEEPKKYRIATKDGIKTVDGYPVNAEGSRYSFFVHKTPAEKGKPVMWNVFETSTGLRVTSGRPTKEGAVDAFNSFVASKGIAVIDDVADKAKKLEPATSKKIEPKAPESSFQEGDRVTWTGREGETLTGTVTSADTDVDGKPGIKVSVDQIVSPGGVPVRRTEYLPIELKSLKKIQPNESAAPEKTEPKTPEKPPEAEVGKPAEPEYNGNKETNKEVSPNGDVGGTPGNRSGSNPVRSDGAGTLGKVSPENVSGNESKGDVNSKGVRSPGTGEGHGGDVSRKRAEHGPDSRDSTAPVHPAGTGKKQEVKKAAAKLKGDNYVITDKDAVGTGTEGERLRNNVEAIKIIKKLEAENRLATREEQAALVKYVGWGGLSAVFDDISGKTLSPQMKKAQDELKELLTKEEYEAARASTKNAHYTSPEVISAMYQGLKHLGFSGGYVLEPSAGVGHFLGLMPPAMAQKSHVTAIELDKVTGAILKALYPNSDTKVMGFQEADLSPIYDVAISNIPFGDYMVSDLSIPKEVRQQIHNYFFAKALERVRPGGLVMFITSTGTMDSKQPQNTSGIRDYIDRRANFIGAIRLPNTTFKGNAGTEVVTDIIVLQKHGEGVTSKSQPWGQLCYQPSNNGYGGGYINEYYKKCPEMVLGQHSWNGSMYRANSYTVQGDEKAIGPQIISAFKKMQKNIMTKPKAVERITQPKAEEMIPAPDFLQDGSFTVQNGKLFVNEKGKLTSVTVSAKDADRMTRQVEMVRTIKELMTLQYGDGGEAAIKDAQVKLGKQYDDYVAKHGPLHTKIKGDKMADDPEYYRL